MKKLTIAAALIAALAFAVPAGAQSILRVSDPTPTGTFTDGNGNAGYVEVRGDGVRACNEDPSATPLGDAFTGYAWVDKDGNGAEGNTDDDSDPDGITNGNGTVGSGDYDGEGTGAGNENDCPGPTAP